MRFYLLDKITRIELGESIEGIKCWTMTNEIFNDHFPGYPVVPGVLLTESMAQLLGHLIEKTHDAKFKFKKGVFVILSLIHKAKFRSFVTPGDQCIIKGELQSLDYNIGRGLVKTYVNKTLVAEANLVFMILARKDLPDNIYLERYQEYKDIISRNL